MESPGPPSALGTETGYWAAPASLELAPQWDCPGAFPFTQRLHTCASLGIYRVVLSSPTHLAPYLAQTPARQSRHSLCLILKSVREFSSQGCQPDSSTPLFPWPPREPASRPQDSPAPGHSVHLPGASPKAPHHPQGSKRAQEVRLPGNRIKSG